MRQSAAVQRYCPFACVSHAYDATVCIVVSLLQLARLLVMPTTGTGAAASSIDHVLNARLMREEQLAKQLCKVDHTNLVSIVSDQVGRRVHCVTN